MPVESKPIRDGAFYQQLLHQYLILLKKYPILTKSITSGILSAVGSLLSQALEQRGKTLNSAKGLDFIAPLRFAIYGLLFTGPISHYFYLSLEQFIPQTAPFSVIKRLLLDRLIFAPAFLVLFFFIMNVLEGKNLAAFRKKMKTSYWAALKMNWKVWTPFQFININFVPVQFRVLFANFVALFWYAYLASVRK
ncbi:peroxisomal membrane protein 2 [Latimeria chalumnae]|uniref:Peroxisomal membrane protein 2 n=1 Tax=Latimeria chalumnae TaxID=7897 RepID=M3XKW9_LATCH|nr:PREDICTED: peroxisomal membrane protein 2 [Latimeria chalumnae]XP_005993376.1 PREDICTED: peroxisomal membrane protein 2 [Latimeria chalumnae]XP_014342325.1 PREDICTED: peroxisomal membrane protein 2 [Latimeria chalumnae]|eukprot:XP_005993375.1 PREDICTED: peroxisomal membrane protein 2 [Latimeria chalumnae]